MSQTEKVKEDHFEILQSHLFSIERYGHSVHEEGSLPLGTYASHIILSKGTTLVGMMIMMTVMIMIILVVRIVMWKS